MVAFVFAGGLVLVLLLAWTVWEWRDQERVLADMDRHVDSIERLVAEMRRRECRKEGL